MSRRCFLDTNVLVYADDLDGGDKATTAQDLLHESMASGVGVVSTQVLQEFFVVATTKLLVAPADAQRKVQLLATMDVVLIRPELIDTAIDLHRLRSLSFWDALIVSAAATAGCDRIYTEDMQHGGEIDGVRIINPFASTP